MIMTYLAHGGQMTGDEIAIIGGGLSFALLFPVVLLLIVAKTRKRVPQEAAKTEPAATHSALNTVSETSAPVLSSDICHPAQHLPREQS